MAGSHSSTLDDAATSIHAVASSTLTRLWVALPGDLCSTCSMAPECGDRSRCLHLVRSLGISTRTDGPFRRFPFGAREVGRVATRLEPRILNEGLAGSGLADPAWLSLHGIAGFGAWPLVAEGRCLGVAALFRDRPIEEADARAIEAVVRLTSRALLEHASAPRVVAPEAPVPASMADAQRAAILSALVRAGGRVSGPGGAAEMLGMRSTTLESRIRRLGVTKPPRLKLR